MLLALFSDRKLLPPECDQVPMLDPFWRIVRDDAGNNDQLNFSGYVRKGRDYFKLARSIHDADFALLPMDWQLVHISPERKKAAENFIAEAAEVRRQTIVFCFDNSCSLFDWPASTIVFRKALYRSDRKQNEFGMPIWSHDLLRVELNGKLSLRQKNTKPRVGFCGFSPPLSTPWNKQKLKDAMRLASNYMGVTLRKPRLAGHSPRSRALLELGRSRRVETNFIIRANSAFDNPTGAFLPGGTLQTAQAQRRDLMQNTLDSDYVLCARGYANCSIRFYETLCLGRIPVFINTDCVLPYEDQIDWKKYCVWVEESELSHIGEKVAAFHEALSPDDFTERQLACRRLYEEWLSPEGFYGNLHRVLPATRTRRMVLQRA
jgi:hypothetical protein